MVISRYLISAFRIKIYKLFSYIKSCDSLINFSLLPAVDELLRSGSGDTTYKGFVPVLFSDFLRIRNIKIPGLVGHACLKALNVYDLRLRDSEYFRNQLHGL